jgi:hypothetical protein
VPGGLTDNPERHERQPDESGRAVVASHRNSRGAIAKMTKIVVLAVTGLWVLWLAVLLIYGLVTQFIGSPWTDSLNEMHIWRWFYGSLAVGIFGEVFLQKLLRDKSR